jgi:hypothetical protein
MNWEATMKTQHVLRITALCWLGSVIAGGAAADTIELLETWNKPEPLERSGGAYVALERSSDSVFLLHGGLPSELDATPVTDVWVLDGSEWYRMDTSAPAVYGHTIVAAGKGTAFGFGGVDSDDELRSLASVLAYSVWRGDSGLEVTVEEVAVEGPNPGTCSETPVIRLEGRDSMLLVGGMCSYYPGWSSQVWEYRIDANRWYRRADLPRPLRDHTAVTADGQVWVFGGIGRTGRSNDVYRYDPWADSWTEVVVDGARPEPLSDHRAVVIEQSMVVFGGIREPFWPETTAEVWDFDLETLRWTRKPDLPYGLAEMAVGVVPDGKVDAETAQVLLFGGVTDAWSFPLELSDTTWIYTSDVVRTTTLITVPTLADYPGIGASFKSVVSLTNHGAGEIDRELGPTPSLDMIGDPVTIDDQPAPWR